MFLLRAGQTAQRLTARQKTRLTSASPHQNHFNFHRPQSTLLITKHNTMSTPPPQSNTHDLKSPITSPLPKRTKTTHASSSSTGNVTMIPATTSEPLNVPVPVTKVQDGPHLLIKKLSEKAKLPTRGSAFAAGYDLYASKETVIPARGKGLVDTDLAMAVPAGTCNFPPLISLIFSPSHKLIGQQMVELHRDQDLRRRTSSTRAQELSTQITEDKSRCYCLITVMWISSLRSMIELRSLSWSASTPQKSWRWRNSRSLLEEREDLEVRGLHLLSKRRMQRNEQKHTSALGNYEQLASYAMGLDRRRMACYGSELGVSISRTQEDFR